MVDRGAYFKINRARQYGKTTTLNALRKYLSEEYVVLSTDFQLLSHTSFKSEAAFVRAFAREIVAIISRNDAVPEKIKEQLRLLSIDKKSETELGDFEDNLPMWEIMYFYIALSFA